MLSSECWLGYHDHCMWLSTCDCLCHVEPELMVVELMFDLERNND